MDDDFIDPELSRWQKREAKAARARQAQDDTVVQSLMSSEAGRGWVRNLLDACGIFRSTFTGEALQSAFNEGQRNVGLRILADVMRACPDAYIQMMREQNGRRTEPVLDRTDHDDDRNFDSAGRWIGDGEGPDE